MHVHCLFVFMPVLKTLCNLIFFFCSVLFKCKYPFHFYLCYQIIEHFLFIPLFYVRYFVHNGFCFCLIYLIQYFVGLSLYCSLKLCRSHLQSTLFCLKLKGRHHFLPAEKQTFPQQTCVRMEGHVDIYHHSKGCI